MLETYVPASVWIRLLTVTSSLIYSQIIEVAQKMCTFDSVFMMMMFTDVFS